MESDWKSAKSKNYNNKTHWMAIESPLRSSCSVVVFGQHGCHHLWAWTFNNRVFHLNIGYFQFLEVWVSSCDGHIFVLLPILPACFFTRFAMHITFLGRVCYPAPHIWAFPDDVVFSLFFDCVVLWGSHCSHDPRKSWFKYLTQKNWRPTKIHWKQKSIWNLSSPRQAILPPIPF